VADRRKLLLLEEEVTRPIFDAGYALALLADEVIPDYKATFDARGSH
jgi:hypothetical protein